MNAALLRCCVFGLGFVLSFTSARAWDSMGHMLVAQIAWDQLTPEAKANIEKSFANFNEQKKGERSSEDAPYDFVTAACWMDDIRGMRDRYDFGKWHYVNLPFNREGLPEPAEEEGPNVIWAIQRSKDLLTGKETDPTIDPAQALAMFVHTVGDIHQPLHTTNRGGDYGGNAVAVKNIILSTEEMMFSKKRYGNLHSFWDSAYRRGFRDGRVTVLYETPIYEPDRPATGHLAANKIIVREASALRKKYPNLAATELDNPATWAHESHEIGYDLGYGKLQNTSATGRWAKMDERYVNESREAAEKRIVLAGNRLAAELNEIYSSPETATSGEKTHERPSESELPAANAEP